MTNPETVRTHQKGAEARTESIHGTSVCHSWPWTKPGSGQVEDHSSQAEG